MTKVVRKDKKKVIIEFRNAIGMPITVEKSCTQEELSVLREREDVKILKC